MSRADEVDLPIVGGGVERLRHRAGCGGTRPVRAAGRAGRSGVAPSSASTKLIHGGLRYLEYYEFRLVREALCGREVILGIAPHLVKPMRFVMPLVGEMRPAWMIRTGLFLYDHIGGRTRLLQVRGGEAGGTPWGRA